MKRPAANHLKQLWKEFVVWLVQYNNYTNLGIKKCKLIVTYYYRTKQKRDADNYNIKFIGDGLVSSGIIVDDNLEVITSLTIQGSYDKLNPRTEILIQVE
jgi:Holliday junction resolvase RusA-like endonuclease